MNGRATEVLLAVDISSSGIRVDAYTSDLTLVRRARRDLATEVDQHGASLHSLKIIRSSVVDTVHEVAHDDALTVIGVCLSGTASSLTLSSRHHPPGLDPGHLMLWSDTRPAATWPLIKDAAADAYQRTGCPPDVSYWPAKIAWTQASRPIDEDAILVGGKDWIYNWLTGIWVTDPSTAAATGLWNSSAWNWDEALCARLQLQDHHLPVVVEATSSCPLAARPAAQLGLRAGTPVVVGGMDGVLTHLGAVGRVSSVASSTVGTSVAVRSARRSRTSDPTGRTWTYPLLSDYWVSGGAGSNGGNLLLWVRDRFAPGQEIVDLLGEAFATEPDPDLTFVPYLAGERAPLWNANLRATIVGLRPHHTGAHIARAALTGVAAAFADLTEAVQDVSPFRETRFTGGFSASDRWLQLMTDAAGVPGGLPDPGNSTGLGIALVGWGGISGTDPAALTSPTTVGATAPDPSNRHAVLAAQTRIARYRSIL